MCSPSLVDILVLSTKNHPIDENITCQQETSILGMSVSGALGRGSYRSVIAGSAEKRVTKPSYHAGAQELIALHLAHRNVIQNFYLRDKIFDPKFSALAFAKGIFQLSPTKRLYFHNRDLTESIRRRSIWMQRIQSQRKINAKLVEEAEQRGLPHPAEALRTPDAAAYFRPQDYKGSNSWPNFWQHESTRHVIPVAKWQRHPELGGITRVMQPVATQANDF